MLALLMINEDDTEIRNKIWNIEIVVEEIKNFPQTYNTILKEQIKNDTKGFLLRKKLNKLCKQGVICKTTIPGTRFGKQIFYTFPKDYHILVESDRIGSRVYYFKEYRKRGKFHIIVDEYWELKQIWKKRNKQKVFFEGNVLKWI